MPERTELLTIVRAFRGHLEDPRHLMPAMSETPAPKTSEAQPSSLPQGKRQGGGEETLNEIRASLGDCDRCGLCRTRKNIVFGEGNDRARLVFVGEAPGADEDEKGRPFVGRAGELLTKIIEAMGLQRQEVYICNILKCRPPGNRNPQPDEIRVCEPFLVRQLAAICPDVICALGKFAAQTLLKTEAPITTLRGTFSAYHGIPFMPTYHPAYLLRNPSAKKMVWEDVQQIMRHLNKG